MSYKFSNTLLIILLVVGLAVGAGVGYFFAPAEVATAPVGAPSGDSTSPVVPVAPPLPYDGSGHNHLGIWIAILLVAVVRVSLVRR